MPSNLVPLVLYWNHDSLTANHQGFERTLRRIRMHYYWPLIIQDTEMYVRSCPICQRNKEAIPYLKSQLHPNKMRPEIPGEILCMDIAHLPRSAEGFIAALIIVDLFSRLTVALPLRDMTANAITKAITDYCCRHGFPLVIFTDQAGAFKKALQTTCSHLLEVKHNTSVPWRHCANIAERYIRLVKDGLKIVLPAGKFGWWARYIKFVTYAINTSFCKSIDMSPFEAYYARKPGNQPSIGDLKLPTQYTVQTDDWLQPLRESIKHTSVNMKNKYLAEVNARNKSPESTIQEGDLVVIKRHDFQPNFPDKLQARREGPWKVTAVRGTSIDLVCKDKDRGVWTRHISELAPFFVRPEYLSPSKVDLGSDHTPQRQGINAQAPPRIAPTTLYGKLMEHATEQHLIVVGLDAMSRAPSSGTIEELILSLNYYSPYAVTRRNQHREEWEALFTKNPRSPGSITFAQGKTRSNNAIICSMITQAYQGPPTPHRSLVDYQDLPKDLLQLLKKDTKENRQQWLEEAFTKVAESLAEEVTNHPPTGEVLIEGEFLLDRADESNQGQDRLDGNRIRIVEEFTWLLQTLGLSTSVMWREANQRWGGIESIATALPFQALSAKDWPFPDNAK